MGQISPPVDYALDVTPKRVGLRRRKSSSNGNRRAAPKIPDLTLEAFSRTFHAEAVKYGFATLDYVRFVNLLLDRAMRADQSAVDNVNVKTLEGITDLNPVGAAELPLEGERITVRALDRLADRPFFEQWLQDPMGSRFLQSRTNSQTSELDEVMDSASSVFGIIEAPSSDDPIGCVAFLNHDRTQQKAELRKLIGNPAYRGKGLAREASALWIRYGIEVLGLKKIYLSTFETDIRNIRLNEQLGFKVEGVLRSEVVVDGVRRDVLRMALIVDEVNPQGTTV